MNFDIRNIIERFVWTFVQAAVGALSVVSVQAAILGVNLSALRAIGLTALGAGVAAVLSLAKNLTAEGIVVQSAKRTATTANERYVAARLATDAGSQPAKRKTAKP